MTATGIMEARRGGRSWKPALAGLTPLDRADRYLAEMRELGLEAEAVESEAREEMERVRARYEARLGRFRARLAELDRSLKDLMKQERVAVFDGRDKVRLPNGLLFHTREARVTLPREALERIKEQGWFEAVAVVERVDRPVVEVWPEERLAVIGARRRMADRFAYELAERGPAAPGASGRRPGS
ncbi:MAG: host-nuclease inhibitor Gam family protein [Proteobacteria bacterium]|nr:host-nuclease inhibitor Gam family protein [Pseudomonadota bacterium]